MRSAKETVRQILDELPDSASLEDIQYHIYVREKVERGLRDVDAGRVVDQDEAKRRMAKWLAGTSIKVSLIASEHEHQGMTPDEIADAHPHLGLADIHAALAYYYDHREQIRREWEETDNLIASLRGRYPSRLAGRKAQSP
jgi:uncharacterized protein (DUF433 family)